MEKKAKLLKEIKSLREKLTLANMENEKLDVQIRLARAEKAREQNLEELKRLQDPDEPIRKLESCECIPRCNY